MSEINKRAAAWWKDRFGRKDRADEFERELLARLPDSDWETYNDYDPEEILLEAVQAAGIECRGYMFSGKGLFPTKTGLNRRGDKLHAKEGYGDVWKELV